MKDYTIITPVYNDWSSLELLISRMDQSLADMKINLKIIVVDDCSTFPNETDYSALKYEVIDEIHLVELTQNLGHQRAIAIGLSYIDQNIETDAVIVMDSDGEDNPSDIKELLNAFDDKSGDIIFASRAKRSENIIFRAFYYLYINLCFISEFDSILKHGQVPIISYILDGLSTASPSGVKQGTPPYPGLPPP